MADVTQELMFELLKRVHADVGELKLAQQETKAELINMRGTMVAMYFDNSWRGRSCNWASASLPIFFRSLSACGIKSVIVGVEKSSSLKVEIASQRAPANDKRRVA